MLNFSGITGPIVSYVKNYPGMAVGLSMIAGEIVRPASKIADAFRMLKNRGGF